MGNRFWGQSLRPPFYHGPAGGNGNVRLPFIPGQSLQSMPKYSMVRFQKRSNLKKSGFFQFCWRLFSKTTLAKKRNRWYRRRSDYMFALLVKLGYTGKGLKPRHTTRTPRPAVALTIQKNANVMFGLQSCPLET